MAGTVDSRARHYSLVPRNTSDGISHLHPCSLIDRGKAEFMLSLAILHTPVRPPGLARCCQISSLTSSLKSRARDLPTVSAYFFGTILRQILFYQNRFGSWARVTTKKHIGRRRHLLACPVGARRSCAQGYPVMTAKVPAVKQGGPARINPASDSIYPVRRRSLR